MGQGQWVKILKGFHVIIKEKILFAPEMMVKNHKCKAIGKIWGKYYYLEFITFKYSINRFTNNIEKRIR